MIPARELSREVAYAIPGGGWGFAVFDHRLSDAFLELAFVASALMPYRRLPPGQCMPAVRDERGGVLRDEPFASLDPRHARRTLKLAREFVRGARTLLPWLHTLRAAHTLDLAPASHTGRLRAAGTPETVLTPKLQREVFGVTARTEPG